MNESSNLLINILTIGAILGGGMLVLLITFFTVRKLLRKSARAGDAYDKDILLIRVPKETPRTCSRR